MPNDLSIPPDIMQILLEIVPKIKALSDVCHIILFGSYSKETYGPESDIDLAVFITKDSGAIFDTYKKVCKICFKYDIDIQPQVFYDDELHCPIGIVEEIVEYGKDITDIA